MEPTEIEKAVGDLELAVDRLRSLYEQYFMGIEKLEPTVPRKDVDRRIYALRKEQIRNTAMRFRFQMILQRYNVYQTHWQRICREIENGTYKRHLLKAERRFGDEGFAKRKGSVLPPAPTPQALSPDLARELAELDADFAAAAPEELADVDMLLDEPAAAPQSASARPAEPQPAPAQRKGPVWRKMDPSPPRHASSPPPPPAPVAPAPPATSAPSPPRAAPPAPPRPAATAPGASAAPPRPAPAAPPAPVVSRAPAPAPAPAVAPAPAAPRPAAPAVPRPSSDDIPEARVRQIYSQYVEAKRRANESTAAITYEAVAKSLRESSAKLRQKHGKTVDFEVAVKDGKAILKPVIK